MEKYINLTKAEGFFFFFSLPQLKVHNCKLLNCTFVQLEQTFSREFDTWRTTGTEWSRTLVADLLRAQDWDV